MTLAPTSDWIDDSTSNPAGGVELSVPVVGRVMLPGPVNSVRSAGAAGLNFARSDHAFFVLSLNFASNAFSAFAKSTGASTWANTLFAITQAAAPRP